MGSDSTRWADAIKAAELALLSSAVRRDPAAVARLLHPEFVEIGRSGRRWTYTDTIEALAGENDRDTPATDEWSVQQIAPHLLLATFRVRGAQQDSRHTSLWDVSDGAPRLRHHHGTFVAEQRSRGGHG